VALIGARYIGIRCMKQVDLKILVAYSSVVHMALVLGGLLSLKLLSWRGSVYLMLGHGFCSSCIFFLLGVTYERLGSRSLILNKGVSFILSSFGVWWFVACMGNISNPPRLSLFGEIILISRMISLNIWLFIVLLLIFFLGSCYSIYLFSQIYHGGYYKLTLGYLKISINEIFLSFIHLFYLNFIFLLLK